MLSSIFWLLTWPVLIYISYRLVVWMMDKYEKKLEETVD